MTSVGITPASPASPPTPFDLLEGSWVGTGRGVYPTVPEFTYAERVTFTRSPKGFLAYQQLTTNPHTGAPMHTESGYLRFVSELGTVEFVLAQPTGVVEIHACTPKSTPTNLQLHFRPVSLALTPSAKAIVAIERNLEIVANELTYTVAMAAVGLPLQHHLAATLLRVPSGT